MKQKNALRNKILAVKYQVKTVIVRLAMTLKTENESKRKQRKPKRRQMLQLRKLNNRVTRHKMYKKQRLKNLAKSKLLLVNNLQQ
jgi:hypothetical protein